MFDWVLNTLLGVGVGAPRTFSFNTRKYFVVIIQNYFYPRFFATNNYSEVRKFKVHTEDILHCFISRSSHQRSSIKKSVLKNFTKFTADHLINLRPATLFKKETPIQVFSCEFC